MKEREVAKVLLEKKAVKLNPKDPFTYVSGIRSPIYCDNRQMIAYSQERKVIIDAFILALEDMDCDVIAGTSTAGIPWAAWIAEKLGKPMSYIRGKKKAHGVGNQIEGAAVDGKTVIVVEDLISTGGSSFLAVEAVREAGGEVLCVASIFTYEFEKAKAKFEEGKCDIVTLSKFSILADVAKEMKYVTEEELKIILEWNKNPKEWGPNNGFPLGEPKV